MNELEGTYEISLWDGQTTYPVSRDINEIKRDTNPVHIRAGLPDYSTEIYASRDKLRTTLKRERVIDFLEEGKRYFDLRRWKDFEYEYALPIYM